MQLTKTNLPSRIECYIIPFNDCGFLPLQEEAVYSSSLLCSSEPGTVSATGICGVYVGNRTGNQ